MFERERAAAHPGHEEGRHRAAPRLRAAGADGLPRRQRLRARATAASRSASSASPDATFLDARRGRRWSPASRRGTRLEHCSRRCSTCGAAAPASRRSSDGGRVPAHRPAPHRHAGALRSLTRGELEALRRAAARAASTASSCATCRPAASTASTTASDGAVEEHIVVPKPGASGELDAWLVGTTFDARRQVTLRQRARRAPRRRRADRAGGAAVLAAARLPRQLHRRLSGRRSGALEGREQDAEGDEAAAEDAVDGAGAPACATARSRRAASAA